MKTIAFVTPWYGENIHGGAEMELRDLVKHLIKTDLKIEILTTCVKDFNSDWNVNYHQKGISYESGIMVRRFPIRKRDQKVFDKINAQLIQGNSISEQEENLFISEMINSIELYNYIEENVNDYELFVYIPYMFGTTYYGIQKCPEKSVMIPCFHDEAYFHMKIFAKLYSKAAGIVYNAKSEFEMANKFYDLKNTEQIIMGIGMDIDIHGNEKDFRAKYNIDVPYLLYAGRKDTGKNVHTLIQYFAEYKKRIASDLKMILIGGGEIEIPKSCANEIIDLGFVDIQDKYDAYSGALALCQPSKNESFSLVIMESWLCGRPVLVHDKCDVTKNFVVESNGGLYFSDYFEFERTTNYLQKHETVASDMGKNGCKYVINNFGWSNIIDNYLDFFKLVSEKTQVNKNEIR